MLLKPNVDSEDEETDVVNNIDEEHDEDESETLTNVDELTSDDLIVIPIECFHNLFIY